MKLFKLREYLTVPEAAKQLSKMFEEDVSESDVLRLALDGRLTLSINFVNGAIVRRTKAIEWQDTDWMMFPMSPPRLDTSPLPPELTSGTLACPPKLQAMWDEIPEDEHRNYFPTLLCIEIDNKLLKHENSITEIDGIWDLAMIGIERLDIEHQYQQLTGGPVVTRSTLSSAYIKNEQGVLHQIQEYFSDPLSKPQSTQDLLQNIAKNKISRFEANILLEKHYKEIGMDSKKWLIPKDELSDFYGAAEGLPSDCVLVVRTSALRDFELLMKEEFKTTESALPNASKPAGHLDHDLEMQSRANEIAAEQKTSRKIPTKSYVAKKLAEELEMDVETVARRIRKQW